MIGQGRRRTFDILNTMLDEAIAGTFTESDYDESELSKLETKWLRFLSAAALDKENREKERQSIQELVSDISHQVKTPIANIHLYGELLEERAQGKDKELALRLLEETERLEFLIQSLIKMSRLETDTIQVQPKVQPLLPLLEEVRKRGEAKRGEKRIQIKEIGWTKELQACFDKKWTAEALYNIFDNALKYTPENSTVTIEVKKYQFFVQIQVSDEGPGILPDEAPLLFGRFYRSPRFAEKEGIGLGLCLAREILKKEGGYIRAAAKKGGGAAFSVYLKCQDVFSNQELFR